MNIPPPSVIAEIGGQLIVHAVVAAATAAATIFVTVKIMQTDIDYVKTAQAETAAWKQYTGSEVASLKEFVAAQRVANENAERRLQRLESVKN